MANYKGIEFAKGYNRSFADFKKEFEHTHIFNNIPEKERSLELKEAYKIATNGGNTTTTQKSKETNTDKGKAWFI